MDSVTEDVNQNTSVKEEVEFVGLPSCSESVDFKKENIEEVDIFQQEVMNCPVLNDNSLPEEDPLELKYNVKSEVKSEDEEEIDDTTAANDSPHENIPFESIFFINKDIKEEENMRSIGEITPEEDCSYYSDCRGVSSSKSMDRKSKKCLTKTNSEMIYKCQHCSKLFQYYSILRNHLQTHTGEKLFECENCKKSFTTIYSLKVHMRIHTGEKPFVCEHCQKSFTQISYLNVHLRTHTGERPFVCELCKKSFTTISNLKAHVRTHTGKKPFACEHCKNSFSRLDALKTHMRIHTGERPYSCEHCKKSFTQLGHLNMHLQTHSG